MKSEVGRMGKSTREKSKREKGKPWETWVEMEFQAEGKDTWQARRLGDSRGAEDGGGARLVSPGSGSGGGGRCRLLRGLATTLTLNEKQRH